MTIANASAPSKRTSVSQIYSPAVVLEQRDTYFNYVTMLLHGDGTNGAQNNTFLDSSSNNYTVTRSGNPTQGSFSPYGSNWGVYFGGVGNYLTTATSASGFSFGTGDFTVEFWINSNQTTRCDPVGQNNGFTSSGWWGFVFNRSSNNTMEWFENTNPRIAATSVTWNNGQWNHVAVTRSGNNVKMFLNGTQVGSTYTTSFTYGASSVGIINGVLSDGKTDGPLTGYLSNVRIVKGTAVYTSSFTPSTTPLTQISGTSLLINQSNRFIDNSTNLLAITTTGSPSVQRFNPFGTSTAYSTSVIGGSGYFDGSGDYIKTTGTVGIAGSAFTICCWFYPLNSSVIGLFDSGPGVAGVFRNYSANLIEDQSGGTPVSIAGDYQVNAWNWMVITKSGTSFTVYINGVSAGAGTCASTMVESSFTVGTINNGGDGSYNGYISDFQVLNSATVVSVPTAPITNASSKTYLINFQNSGILDNAMMNDLETVGNAKISTGEKKYGTGSLAFDGTGDYLIHPSGQNVTFGTGNFTIEGWFYWSSLASESAIMWGNGVGWTFYIYPANKLQWGTTTPQAGANLLTGNTTLATGQWYHIAVTRSSNTLTLWVNGVSDGTVTDSNNYSASGRLALGISHSNEYFNGYMDDVRITKGVARYTTTFTPPTSALEDL